MIRLLAFIYCLFLVVLTVPAADGTLTTKLSPEYNGVAKEFAKYEASYKKLAAARGIFFTNPVTMGFKEIKQKKGKSKIIGLCTYGKNFREIDIDIPFWSKASETSKRSLLYHEMTHCFCGRSHDYGSGTPYPDDDDGIKKMIIDTIRMIRREPGFYFDGCPMSIMDPYLVSDDCVESHKTDYEYEMFNRCKPY